MSASRAPDGTRLHELLDANGNSEIIFQNTLAADRRARLLRQQTGVKQDRVIRHYLPVQELFVAKPNQVLQIEPQTIMLSPSVGGLEMVFLPGPIKQGNKAVMKQIEEISGAGVAFRLTPLKELGVVDGQNAQRTVKPMKFTLMSGG